MKPVTILLAEDNLVLGLFVKRLLQQAGYRVWFCMDTSEAWEYYADKNPDMVLLDDNQALERNFSLANKIRGVNKVVPIMFLSGKTFEEKIYDNNVHQSQRSATQGLSEKKLLQHVHEMMPASTKPNVYAPAYDSKKMKLCGPEDILILTTFFEDTMHLRQYVPN
jgi:CheY-like chemotaxis protein